MPLILLAEDESSTIDHVRAALASQGWLVKTVGTRDQALRAASEFAPQLVLVNVRLTGAEDLVRTFSRRSGGPGVVLLTTENGDGNEASAAYPDVDAILAKPLDTGALIETIRRGLVDGRDKPAPPPVTDTNKVFSSEEIFGDLLDDILDPAAVATPETTQAEVVAASPEPVRTPEPEPEKEVEPLVDITVTDEVVEEPEPELEEEPEPEKEVEPLVDIAVTDEVVEEPEVEVEEEPEPEKEIEPLVDITVTDEVVEEPEPELEEETETLSVAGLEDLEEVVREGVEAWADSRQPDETDEGEPDQPAEAAQASPEPEPEPDEDLGSKLEDTLAGVLAASLSQAETGEIAPHASENQSETIDALLNQALGDLDLGAALTAPAIEEVSASEIDDEIDALAAAVEVEPIAEIEELDVYGDLEALAGVKKEPASVAAAAEIEGVEDDLEVDAAPDQIEKEPGTPPTTAPKGIEFGEYTLELQIGVGGMASVWKARRKGVEGFEKRVAIKKILPQAAENEDFVEMFIDEAKLAAQLNHSNITHIYDLGKIDDDYFIAMEYVEGKNLRQILDKTRKKEQPVPVGVAVFIAAQIADALDYAHRSKDFDDAELGLVHRDVSPQNVLISYAGDIKLCDFGIAKAVSKISTTQMGALKGKLQYMSPEQAWGRSIDHRSDLFSLGTLLYEMLTGERLFTGESEMAVLEAVREADVGTQIIQSPDISAGAKGILLRTLAKEPEDRFGSAEELQRGLEELIKEESPAPGPKSLSAFVRELLDMQDEPPEPVEDEEPKPQIEVADGLEWVPESPAEDDEGETTPWLRRILTRLLPVILVVVVGGGIIAGLMQKDAPSVKPPAEQAAQVAGSPAFEPVKTSEESTVTPQGQPPPVLAAADPTPAPPAKSRPPEPEPEPEPIITEDPRPADVVPVEVAKEPAAEATETATDPELERRVEEDLQRVQELMTTPVNSEDPAPADETSQETAEEPFTLESLWSDVIAVDETGVEEEPTTEAVETSPDAEPETRPGDLVQAGPGVIEPQVVAFEQPEYTRAARRAGAKGTVRVAVLVDENGRALEVRLIEGLYTPVGLEEAVIESARNAVYRPASKDGIPVKMWYELAVRFEP